MSYHLYLLRKSSPDWKAFPDNIENPCRSQHALIRTRCGVVWFGGTKTTYLSCHYDILQQNPNRGSVAPYTLHSWKNPNLHSHSIFFTVILKIITVVNLTNTNAQQNNELKPNERIKGRSIIFRIHHLLFTNI